MKKIMTNLKENIFQNQEIYIWSLVAISLVLFVCVMYNVELSSNILSYTSHKNNRAEVQIIRDFTADMEIRQKFQNYSDFDFITLRFANHDKKLSGKIGVLITDIEEEKVITYTEIDMWWVSNSRPEKISLEEGGGGKANRQYEIALFSAATEEEALGVFGYKSDNEKAVINGEESEYALSIGIHSNTSLYYDVAECILSISIITIFILIIGALKFKLAEENMFLFLVIPFIFSMLLLWPGNDVYDQIRHQNTVYHYSNVILGKGDLDIPEQIYMRKCDAYKASEIEEVNSAVNSQAHAYYYYVDKMWDKATEKEMISVDISKAPLVTDGSFIQYTPGIVGMTLARILGCNYFWMLTISRLSIIGFYLAVCYYAIRKIPVLKMMVAFVAALPMNLYQVSGISYDGFTFAVGIVVFAFIIKLWHSGLQKKDWFVFTIFVFLLGNCKGGVYLTLILLMLFIPKEKYVQKKWVKCAGILSVAVVSMLSSFLPTIKKWINMSVAGQKVIELVSTSNDISGIVASNLSPMYVVSNPKEFVSMFVRTVVERIDVYVGQMLGYRTAWSNEPIPLVVVLPFLILLIMSAVNKKEEKFTVNLWGKIGIVVILLIELIGMHIIFLPETSVYGKIINGFQGRYFILFLPCILLLFRNEGLEFREKKEHLYVMYSMAQLVYWYFFLRMFMLH